MLRRVIPCAGVLAGSIAWCDSTNSNNNTTANKSPLFSKHSNKSNNFFQGISANADFIPYSRPTDDERKGRGCVGKNFVYNNNDISTQYFWSPTRNEICGSACFSVKCEGPPRRTHGGAIAAALDDAMSQVANAYLEQTNSSPLNFSNEVTDSSTVAVAEPIKPYKVVRCVTGTLSISYRKPIPLDTCQIICARVDRQEDRKIHVVAEVSDGNGTTFVEASGVWIVPRKRY